MTARNWRKSSVISVFHSRSPNIARDPRRVCSAFTAGENITSSGPLIANRPSLLQFLAELACHFLDELPGDAARTRAARHRPLDRLLVQALDRHAELIISGVAFDHGEERVLVGIVEAQPQAEAVAERHLLLDRLRRIYSRRALVLDHVARHQVATVGRGIEDHVVRPAL